MIVLSQFHYSRWILFTSLILRQMVVLHKITMYEKCQKSVIVYYDSLAQGKNGGNFAGKFPNMFLERNLFVFLFKFCWSLLPWIQMTVGQSVLVQILVQCQLFTVTWTSDDPVNWRVNNNLVLVILELCNLVAIGSGNNWLLNTSRPKDTYMHQ